MALLIIFEICYVLFFGAVFMKKCNYPKTVKLFRTLSWILAIASITLFVAIMCVGGIMTIEIFIINLCGGLLIFTEIIKNFMEIQ